MNTFWSDTEINWMINEALRVWNIATGYNRDSQQATVTATSSNFYARSNFTTTGIIALRIENSNTHLDSITLKELGALAPTWLGFSDGSLSAWVHTGLNLLALYPVPQSSPTLTTYYVDTAPIPSGDNSYIQVGEEDMSAIIEYVSFIASIKEGGQELKDAVGSLQFFLKAAAKYNARIIKTSLYRKVLGAPFQNQQRPDALETQRPR